MQESMATEVLNLEDALYFLSLEETRLDRAAAQHRTRLTNRPRIGSGTGLGMFIYACRLYDLQSDLSSTSASGDAFFNSLLSAFAAPSSREWWPADSDVRGVADGFCKLQRVYEVSVARIVAMISRRLPSVSPQDLSLIARGCYANATHGNTTAWSEQALAAGLYAQDSPRNLELGLWWLQANDARRVALDSKHQNLYPAPPDNDVDEYKSVCPEKGDLRSTTAELSCVMWTGDGDPRLILAPLKLEVLSLTPRVVVFADFLTPSEVGYIQDAGHTGLSLESSEPYQVANYGLGGHYTPHDDANTFEQVADEWDTRDGNRLATMLLYLTDVSLGGATAFVRLQLAVKPRRGSALFWYDLAPYSGNDGPIHFDFWHQRKAVEELTNHVGCPVLWGTKWIATKWIRERNNVVVRFDYPG
ncbi:prolyl 4-hydroxylase subunit alpha-2-like [Rhipicephalus sanguineus]|uniref:prolyl 4-hydroxylase subunit alpha-2-like n=1 Tax=Rhipicephalus sanguineus TaxID=34632 RepID=UPI001895E7B1|nr:prolyl 4-hydroxylase subunit alpha-2-like [Rhipicephalus sanguineus]